MTVLTYSITYYQKDLFICAHYANKHKATALHKAYWLPCYNFSANVVTFVQWYFLIKKQSFLIEDINLSTSIISSFIATIPFKLLTFQMILK